MVPERQRIPADDIVMKSYLGAKAIQAIPMTAEDAEVQLQRDVYTQMAKKIELGSNEHKGSYFEQDGKKYIHPGYLVRFPNSYTTWIPYLEFEATYFEWFGAAKNTMTMQDIEACIVSEKVTTLTLHGKPSTHLELLLRNGFTIREDTTCVDPSNYSEEIGADICRKKAHDQVWMLMGFLLQQASYGNIEKLPKEK